MFDTAFIAGFPASQKSQKFDSQVRRVGNSRKSTIEVGKKGGKTAFNN